MLILGHISRSVTAVFAPTIKIVLPVTHTSNPIEVVSGRAELGLVSGSSAAACKCYQQGDWKTVAAQT